MRKMMVLVLALCMSFVNGYAEMVPGADYENLLRSIGGSFDLINVQDAGDRVFILVQQNDQYHIFIFKCEGVSWELEATSNPQVKQTDSEISIHLPVFGSSAFYLDCVDVNFSQQGDDVYSNAQYSFRLMPDNTWQLSDYRAQCFKGKNIIYDINAFLYPYEVRITGLIYPNTEYDDYRIFGTLDKDLRYFDIDRIPLTPEDAILLMGTNDLAMVSTTSADVKLDLHALPSNNSLSLGQYYSGRFVTVIEKTNDLWVKVNCLGIEGYMLNSSLAFADQYDQVIMAYTQRFLESDQKEPLFLQPQEKSDIVAYIQPNAELFIWGVCNNGWGHVMYENVCGYIKILYLGE